MSVRTDPRTGLAIVSGGPGINLTPAQRALADCHEGASIACSIKGLLDMGRKYTTASSVLFPLHLERLASCGLLNKRQNLDKTGCYYTWTNLTNAWCNTAMCLADERNQQAKKDNA